MKLGYQQGNGHPNPLDEFVGENPSFRAKLRKLLAIARCDGSVLVLGETGTGKDPCARAIHALSPRSQKPFLEFHCINVGISPFPERFFAGPLAAFTRANAPPWLLEAGGGTVVLGFIEALSLVAQARLAGFLQRTKDWRDDSSERRGLNVRVIAVSNANLRQAVRKGRFHKGLYSLLSATQITMPPLRAHKDDIPLLTRHFLERFSRQYALPCPTISPEALRKLAARDWPGNVRELMNTLLQAMVFSRKRMRIEAEDIRSALIPNPGGQNSGTPQSPAALALP